MFLNKLKKIILEKRKRKEINNRKKLFLFSAVSASIASLSTIFLSKKENRLKLQKNAKETFEKFGEKSKKTLEYSKNKLIDLIKKLKVNFKKDKKDEKKPVIESEITNTEDTNK